MSIKNLLHWYQYDMNYPLYWWFRLKVQQWGRLSEKYLIDNQLRGPDSSSTLKKADETNLK